jgi:hypothetical protein
VTNIIHFPTLCDRLQYFQFCSRKFLHQWTRYYFFFILWGGTKSTRYCGHFWPIVQTPDDRWGWLWSNWWNEDWQGKLKYSEKTCPSTTLSTTNPTWPDPGLKPGRRGGKPATNRLSYGVAFIAPGVKRPGCKAYHSPRTIAEVKKTWIYTSTPLYVFIA